MARVEKASSPFTKNLYPVLGVLNEPASGGSKVAWKGLSTPYSRQVGRSIIRYFRDGSVESSTAISTPSSSPPMSDTGQDMPSWDALGPSKRAKWQIVTFGSADEIAQHKTDEQQNIQGAGSEDKLSPRAQGGELWGDGMISEKWVSKLQSERVAAVMSLHTLQASKTVSTHDGGMETAVDVDLLVGDEIARNRERLSASGLGYSAVVVINRALSETADIEGRLRAVLQRSGLEAAQFSVCWPGTAQQFTGFLNTLERRLFSSAVAYYSDAFMRTQRKVSLLPQLPIPAHASRPETVYDVLMQKRATTAALFGDQELIENFTQFLPLRAWLIRYHFKMGAFAECCGDRSVAQRCFWIAYLHAFAYVGEIASGAYLPSLSGSTMSDGSGAPVGWMWALNGGDGDGSRAHSLRMFGQRWDEALVLLDAIHVRIVRSWMYQHADLALSAQQTHHPVLSSMSPPLALAVTSPIYRNGARATSARESSQRTTSTRGNTILEPLIFSVHAGEVSSATEQLMEIARTYRKSQNPEQQTNITENDVYFVTIGSETADVDLIQPSAPASDPSLGWWPLGGHFAAIDLNKGRALRPGEIPRLGLVANNASDSSVATATFPHGLQYDVHLALAARQCALHISTMARILRRGGFGEWSSYFWAWVSRQYTIQAELYLLATVNNVDFSAELARAVEKTGLQDTSVEQRLVSELVGLFRLPATISTDEHDSGPASAKMNWKGGRPRAPSSALAGFAFDQTLGSIYAVPKVARATPVADSESSMSNLRNVFSEFKIGHSSQKDNAITGGEQCVAPLWMWPDTVAHMYHSAALAGIQRYRRAHEEDKAYLLGQPTSPDLKRMMVDNPGVENTYASVWLVGERNANEQNTRDVCKLLTLALANTPQDSEPELNRLLSLGEYHVYAHNPRKLTSGTERLYFYIASELAEVYAETSECKRALDVFKLLARRFRAESFAVLTGHALQWVVKCAASIGDVNSMIAATIELLSPELVASAGERKQIILDLVNEAENANLDGIAEIEINMFSVYSPIICHSQFCHWRLSDNQTIKFQVAFDCRGLEAPLQLESLTISFSDNRFDIHITSVNEADEDVVQPVDVALAGEGTHTLYMDISDTSKKFNIVLCEKSICVFEGVVDIGDKHVTDNVLALESTAVSLLMNPMCSDKNHAARATLVWPTHAPDISVLSDSSLLSRHYTPAVSDEPLSRFERQLLGHINASRQIVPATSQPADQRWLDAQISNGLARGQWVQLLSPAIANAVTAFSRCRVVSLPEGTPAASLSVPSVAELAPAYQGEAFPVEVVVTNLHRTKQLVRASVDVQIVSVGLTTGFSDSMSELEVADIGSPQNTAARSPSASYPSFAAANGAGIPKQSSAGDIAWLSLSSEPGEVSGGTQAVRGVEMVQETVGPGESCSVTVFVHFPAATLSAAWKASLSSAVFIKCTARYSHDADTSADTWWDMQLSTQVSIPVTRPLIAIAEAHPGHVSLDAAREMVDVEATELFGDGEYCFRRPIAITLHNTGPWPIAVDKLALRPPLLSPASALRVQISGSTADKIQGAVVAPGATLKYVFVVDVLTRDAVRVPSVICPGSLEVIWRRDMSLFAPVMTRLWVRPIALIARQCQVESVCSAGVSRLGEPLRVTYRVLNATRSTASIEVAMHASDAFVFAGARRTAFEVLPGHVRMLEYCFVPISVSASATRDVGPGQGTLAAMQMGEGTGGAQQGWVRFPRLDVRLVAGGTKPQYVESTSGRVQPMKMLLALAGLEDGAVVAPELVEGVQIALPESLVWSNGTVTIESCEDDGESEFEDDEGACGAVDSRGQEVAEVQVLRLDQTTIFCTAD